jgi:hypothetical protein
MHEPICGFVDYIEVLNNNYRAARCPFCSSDSLMLFHRWSLEAAASSPQSVPPADAPELHPCKDQLNTLMDLWLMSFSNSYHA